MDRQLVECVECRNERFHDREDCTPVESDGRQVYLCLHHRKRYTCDLCGDVEYTAECRATHWCVACAERMDAVAEDIIADYEMRVVQR